MQYDYSKGDLIETPNTYFYTSYQGKPFLDVWGESRAQTLSECISLVQAPKAEKATLEGSHHDGSELLEYLMYGLQTDCPDYKRLHFLIRNFEITKRIYDCYTGEVRSADKKRYHNHSLYLRFAEVIELACAKLEGLNYVNALLKIMDTLCSIVQHLDSADKGRLARLINCERNHIENVATNAGIAL